MRVLLLFLAAGLAAAAPLPRAKPEPPDAAYGVSLAAAAFEQTRIPTVYDPSYVRIAYPGGDVAPGRGVCADVVVRAYRALGTDLQVLVHRDMARAFDAYPRRWGLARPDPNIDHRRVPNLETFFRRHGAALAAGNDPAAYRPGDLVAWMVAGSRPHIGIVSNFSSADGERPLVIHDIGLGPQLEDALFAFPVVGHYRFRPE